LEQTWRWFGPNDDVTLAEIRQTGATGIVTALHDIPYGEVWPIAAIRDRQRMIAEAGLTWSVVESLPIHEHIKQGAGDLDRLFGSYRDSLRNLAACGISVICTNFMPVLDWTRTRLDQELPSGARALRFDAVQFAAFDALMLARPGAEDEHASVMPQARAWWDASAESDRARLLATIMAGLPGAFDRYDIAGLRRMLDIYRGIDCAALRANMARFLHAVVPTAEELGMRLCWHPDDPPRPLLGLPRVVGSAEDFRAILAAAPSPANGITFCTGSLGAGAHNDITAMAEEFAPRVPFAHLRNVRREADGSFFESDHLDGEADMVAVLRIFLAEERRRRAAGREDWRIAFRPDHGHLMAPDFGRKAFPGYSLIGRMKGLAELRGVIHALETLS
jgi:mannonate dehydratase